VEERKLGVWGKKREEKPMAWVWGEKSKRENPNRKLIGR
jgi:hypothetical protein